MSNFVQRIGIKRIVITALVLSGAIVAILIVLNKKNLQISDAAAASLDSKVTFYPSANTDITNEDGNVVSFGSKKAFIGSGESTNSWFGIRFAVTQQLTTATKAVLSIYTKDVQWIGLSTEAYVENSSNSNTFSNTDRVSARKLSVNKIVYANDIKWSAGTYNDIDVTKALQEVLTLNPTAKYFTVVIKNTSTSQYSRKFFETDLTNDTTKPKLTISYTDGSTTPTPPPVNPTPTPTPVPNPVPNPVPPPTSGTGLLDKATAPKSAAFGIWTPTQYDTCPKDLHDTYSVIGPDGKVYPTWHPPVVVNPATGKECSFGHEHGDDPSKSPLFKDIQEEFYFDANKNGKMDPEEQAVAGLPFGYVNEQTDAYYVSQGQSVMRHEDHVGHKVSIATLPIKLPSSKGQITTNVTCQYLLKGHQGTSTKDAFQNNLHEVIYAANCSDGAKTIIAQMGQFGKAGEFTGLCDINGVRNLTKIQTGLSYSNAAYPGVSDGNGNRQIQTRDCINQVFLVPEKKWSANAYEAWPVVLSLTSSNGNSLVSGVNLLFDVENAARFYDPGKPNNVGYFMDLCYETEANGDKMRGGSCDGATDYGNTKGITWDNPKSPFNDTNRGNYFFPPTISNQTSSTTYYADPFGKDAGTTQKTGYIKQFISTGIVSYSKKFNSNIDPTVVNKTYDNGKGTVHAPN
ncbi:MAG: hypothetical protein ACMG57_03525 [Candidatus Dojkabacteria bacterium]